MNKKFRLPLFAALIVAFVCATGLTGCKKDLVFDVSQVQSGILQQDSVQVGDKYVALTPEMAALVDPAKIVRAGTPIYAEKLTPKAGITTAINAVGELPIPYANVVSYGLNGILSIAGIFLAKGIATKSKVNASLVKGVDTFRDILDQTEGGQKLDQHLTTVLQNQQSDDDVLGEVRALLDRYATPAKPPASELTAAALAAK